MANEQNLKPFQPGQSGNPRGSSRKQRLTNALIKAFDESEDLEAAFIKAGVDAAKDRDFRFWSYIFDRIDGPMKGKDEGAEKDQDEPGTVPADIDAAIRALGYVPAVPGDAQPGPLRDDREPGPVEAGPAPEAPE